ncbi:hydroxypyruvate isomerase family protein [Roseibium sediminis]|uniref:hydroxypyruvate isomerase family protein n=1 Tax=Roseibium sediminis TaxID=1775174 RepID=UPI00123D0BF4|nr:TIM barrel protein [Roseibium sediminis]
MIRFSANLGFLWTELPLVQAISAAKANGFEAVEVHWPYDVPAEDLNGALAKADIPLLCLNTRPGNREAGEFGLAALPGREAEARAAIDEALDYARAVNARYVHVMAGLGEGLFAHNTFVANLDHALNRASDLGLTILIEPINHLDVPGYFLGSFVQAADIIVAFDSPNLKMMFDCYHAEKSGEDIQEILPELLHLIRHIQFASPEGRAAPKLDDPWFQGILETLETVGWGQPIGAEYKTNGATEETLGWMGCRTSVQDRS